ncbi:MAG TPA: SIR2 family protein [Terriglobales bacterium]|nr:SIR2 family protein [Terriglobales bacterium]
MSAWNEYPTWIELARQLRREFFSSVADFDNRRAVSLIDKDLPAFFQLCKDLDKSTYLKFLTKVLGPKQPSALYTRLIQQIRELPAVLVVTTNADEMLEQSLGPIRVIQKTDLSSAIELCESRTSFIAKLHGTASNAESLVFATEDYAKLVQDQAYLSSLRTIFAISTVLFLGYSVRDQYVLDLLAKHAEEMRLFGPGPHFVATSDATKVVAGVHRIVYRTRRYTDHRAALTLLDCAVQSRRWQVSSAHGALAGTPIPIQGDVKSDSTAYYITDFKPPGTWLAEETAEIKDKDGNVGKVTIGLGFSNDELPTSQSTAMHDFTVGLICFDRVYLQLVSLAALFSVVKEDLFRELIEADVLRFIHTVTVPAVIYRPGDVFGDLRLIRLGGQNAVPISNDGLISTMPVREMLERQVVPAQGKEKEGRELIDKIERCVVPFEEPRSRDIGFDVSDALLMPDIPKLLGISEAISPSQVPLWLMFPYLRLADLVHTGSTCTRLTIQAAKVPFGGSQLISAAFGIPSASEWAERVASYSVSGRFDTNLGAYVLTDPQILRKILRFRSSQEGLNFRREVRTNLMRETGAEFTASVNAGLARNIPSNILQRAHDKLSLLTESSKITPVPAVWTDLLNSDNSTLYWRRKSFRLLQRMRRERKLANDDPCICGSGDKLRLCCLAPLKL